MTNDETRMIPQSRERAGRGGDRLWERRRPLLRGTFPGTVPPRMNDETRMANDDAITAGATVVEGIAPSMPGEWASHHGRDGAVEAPASMRYALRDHGKRCRAGHS